MKRTRVNRRLQYRALLSDVLPYELPVIFSNRGFCKILQRYGIKLKEGRLTCDEAEEWLGQLLNIINGTDKLKLSYVYKIFRSIRIESVDGQQRHTETETKTRTLTIPHPLLQVEMAKLYFNNTELMVHFAGKSRFSIRFPYKPADFQACQREFYPVGVDAGETCDKTVDVKHFFVYKHYQNINAFYGDYRFQRAEKKYSFMVRTDILHCFDNIRAEDYFRAVYDIPFKEEYTGFAAQFVRLQRQMSLPAVNQLDMEREAEKSPQDIGTGILIGPEFSRIYAEVILQAADRELEDRLYRLDGKRYKTGRDYVFYRYVDDGFLFCNDSELAGKFPDVYNEVLAEWHLKVNKEKVKLYLNRPFIEPLTIVKRKLNRLVEDMFTNHSLTLKGILMENDGLYDKPFKMESKYYISDMQEMLTAYDCRYEDVSSGFLSCIRRKLGENVIEPFYKDYRDYLEARSRGDIDETGRSICEKYEESFAEFCCELVSLILYVYSCDPRMSTSIKTEQIIVEMLGFIDGKAFDSSGKCLPLFGTRVRRKLYKKVNDELRFIFENSTRRGFGMELANLMLVWHKLPPQFRPTENKLVSCLMTDGRLKGDMTFLSVFTLEHLIGRCYPSGRLHEAIKQWITGRLAVVEEDSAEAVYIKLICLSCPYFTGEEKACMCGGKQLSALIGKQKKIEDLFINWRWDKIQSMNSQKTNAEVY